MYELAQQILGSPHGAPSGVVTPYDNKYTVAPRDSVNLHAIEATQLRRLRHVDGV